MQLTGLLHGAPLLKHVDFPTAEVLGPDATRRPDPGPDQAPRPGLHQAAVQGRRRQEGQVGPDRPRHRPARARWPRRSACTSPNTATATPRAKANGVTFEGGVPAEHEVYFSITDDTRFRAPTITITHRGGVDIEELDKTEIVTVPFDALTGLKAFVDRQCAGRHRRAARDRLAAGAAPAQAVGTDAPLRHDDAGAEPDPHAARRQGPADAGGLRLQVRLRPRRPAGGAARPAGAPVRRRRRRLRAGSQRTAHAPGPVGRVRDQRARARSWRRPSAAAPTAWSPRCSARRRASARTSAATRRTRR